MLLFGPAQSVALLAQHRDAMLQEAQVPYGYIMTDEQLWLAYIERPSPKEECAMYVSNAISMRYSPRRPTVPMALLWLASQHTVDPQKQPKSGGPPPPGPIAWLKALSLSVVARLGQSEQPAWRHVPPPELNPRVSLGAAPQSCASLEFDPYSKPIGRGATGTVWRGLVGGQCAAVKVSHPGCADSVEEMQMEALFYTENVEMQGQCIPRLLGQGWIHLNTDEAPSYWLATSLEGPALSSLQPLTESEMLAAKQALHQLHVNGAEHNDVRWDNIVLQGICLLLTTTCFVIVVKLYLEVLHVPCINCLFVCLHCMAMYQQVRLPTCFIDVAGDSACTAAEARCLLIDHGRATWGYQVSTPSWEEDSLEALILQQRMLRTSRPPLTRPQASYRRAHVVHQLTIAAYNCRFPC